MTRRRPAALAGVAFALLFGVAAVTYGSGAGSDPAEIAAYFADGGNRARQLVGFAVLLAAIVCLVVFVAVLVDAVERHGAVVAIAGAVVASGLLGADALWAASSATVELEPRFRLNPQTHLLLEDTGFLLFVGAMAVAAVLVGAASIRVPAFPRWFAWLGAPVAAACLAAWWYFPAFAFLAWVAVSGVLLAAGGPSVSDRGPAG